MYLHLKNLFRNTLSSYFILAFIAMTGLAYINFLPGVVNALVGNINYSNGEAGRIVSSNSYGGIVGTLLAIFLARYLTWRVAIFIFLTLLILVDLGTSWINGYPLMVGWRFIAGILGGICTGIAFSVLARLQNPDRAFGILLFIQFFIGSLVISILPMIEKTTGSFTVFYIMASLSIVSILLLPLAPKLTKVDSTPVLPPLAISFNKEALLILLSMLLYQSAASAIYAYVGLIGLHANIDQTQVNLYIAATGLLGLLSALLPVFIGKRFGRTTPLLLGVIASIVASICLAKITNSVLFITALTLLFFSWPAILSYLFAVSAELDKSGQLSTIAAVVSSIGIATGPMLASILIDYRSFSIMLYCCVVLFVFSGLFLYHPVKNRDRVSNTPFAKTTLHHLTSNQKG
ncbi:MFS transporter [Thalassotalea sp. 1_MG-2023]|uniref:MFS transporter n=1 Tax=Thalassotalea sp. 1_MG-2023 TaxID=3062680 RepID=UPI0026E33498|nr:MFS transporter [Thalassotalea sp. 1_MG-2023]MDO6427328.1 MFS transporter [Thalassotalea sp. 1_MG-2023]